jgi:hypothetical protein
MSAKARRESAGGSVGPPGETYRIEVTGRLDRHETEALQLEIRALAKRHGLTVRDISVRRPLASGSV